MLTLSAGGRSVRISSGPRCPPGIGDAALFHVPPPLGYAVIEEPLDLREVHLRRHIESDHAEPLDPLSTHSQFRNTVRLKAEVHLHMVDSGLRHPVRMHDLSDSDPCGPCLNRRMIEWQLPRYGRGPYDEVPPVLERVLRSPSSDEEGWQELWHLLATEGLAVSAASFAALPYLWDIARAGETTVVDRALDLAGAIMAGVHQDHGADDLIRTLAPVIGLGRVSKARTGRAG